MTGEGRKCQVNLACGRAGRAAGRAAPSTFWMARHGRKELDITPADLSVVTFIDLPAPFPRRHRGLPDGPGIWMSGA